MRILWELGARYWPDFVVAVVLAVLVDMLRISSHIREGWRWLKDKLAEGSIADLNKRIGAQEQYRDTLQSYLASDKAFYLAILRSMAGILLIMCIAGMLLIMGRLRAIEFPGAEFLAVGALAVGIIVGISTMQLGSYDTSKISELIRKVDAELERLRDARSKLTKRS
jgi:hypothetical protein